MPLQHIDSLLQDFHHLATVFFQENNQTIRQLIKVMVQALEGGQKLIFFGNGGSAAQAQHLAAEFVNRFLIDRQPLAALALTCDSSVVTSIANDYRFDDIFLRQLQALGRPGDVAVGLSTSGTSVNVTRALEYAGKHQLITAGFLGNDGGTCKQACDYPLVVNSSDTPRIQEVHLLLGHLLCEVVEREVCTRTC
ncbi:MAG: SIS domain-containing protein [Deltaproteobacteria bacterium]|nr:SIS domain-containing protein [Candidatus Anaeroferrophillus wilburensis]MBN2889675.1 SIS domain-containing protein [Deltaproteobacteria bacterium]